METIIYRFPRSQYWSHLAVKNLCIYAKNFYYSDNESPEKNDNNAFIVDDIDFSEVNRRNSTFLCEKSNSILLNAIRSNDIYEYQKYLILRELYFDKKKCTISLDNFKTRGNPPFDILIQNELKKISEPKEIPPLDILIQNELKKISEPKEIPPLDILIQNQLNKISESYCELELPLRTIVNELIN